MSQCRVSVLLAVLVVFLPSLVLAQGYREAETEFAKGELLLEMKDYPRAIFALKKAWSIMPDTRYLAALVKAYFAHGDAEKALVYGELYLERAVGTPDEKVVEIVRETKERFAATSGKVSLDLFPLGGRLTLSGEDFNETSVVSERPLVRWLPLGPITAVYEKDGFVSQKLALHVQPEQLTEVQAALAMDQGTSELVVDCNVEEAALSVDGKEVGRTPFAGTIPSGEHILQVWAPNHLAWTGVIDAPAKKAVSVQARLVPTTSPTATIATPTVVYDEQGGWSLSTWGWITMGAGVAAAGMGGYFYYVMLDKATQANEVGSGPKFDKLQTEVQTNWMYTMVFLGAGGAVVGGGLLMVLLDPGSDDEDSTPLDLLVLSPSATPGGAAVNAMFSF